MCNKRSFCLVTVLHFVYKVMYLNKNSAFCRFYYLHFMIQEESVEGIRLSYRQHVVYRIITGVNVVSVTDIPRWRAMFLVSFTIVDFVIITQHPLVFRVIFNVLLNFKLKWYRFSHILIALKWRNRQEKKTQW